MSWLAGRAAAAIPLGEVDPAVAVLLAVAPRGRGRALRVLARLRAEDAGLHPDLLVTSWSLAIINYACRSTGPVKVSTQFW